MKINRMDNPFPVVFIDDFIPSPSLVRAAAESYDEVEDWVKYGGEDVGQVQWCNRLGRENITSTALILMDYMATYFDPNKIFGLTDNDYQLIAKNFAQIRNQLKITNDILDKYNMEVV